MLCLGVAFPCYGASAERASQKSSESVSQKSTESASQNSTESASQNSTERSSQDALKELESELALARANLHISEATEERISSELERLKKSGNADPQVIEDYETYLSRVQDMVLENRKIVQKMEALYAKYRPQEGAAGDSTTDSENVSIPQIPDEKDYNELGTLDRELDQSLAAFDEMLLKELDKIRSESAGKMKDLTEEAAAAAERLKEKGVGEGASSGEETSSPEEALETGEGKKEPAQSAKSAESASQKSTESPSQKSAEKGGKEAQTTAGYPQGGARGGQGEGPGSVQKQSTHPSGYDDDIVARQIREAAEKETDPVLKEKLWKEYEDYKKRNQQ